MAQPAQQAQLPQQGQPLSQAQPDAVSAVVDLVDVASAVGRPEGPRFGALVHAVLAFVPLDADPRTIADATKLQARMLGATPDEDEAAREVVVAVLAHPLMARARAAWAVGRCRRETPVAGVGPDGMLLEGVLNLAFEGDEAWTVVDFKVAAEIAGALERYRRQVGVYASIVRRATGREVRAVLMRV